MTDRDTAGEAPGQSDAGGMSRRAFLSMSWRRDIVPRRRDPVEPAPAQTLARLGEIESIRRMKPAAVMPSPARPDIYVVRTEDGIIAIHSRCPNDGAPVTWRPDDRSEDNFAERGRFYCARDASIFDRLGALIAGPAAGGLPTVVVREIDGALWADLASPDLPGGDSQLARQFRLRAD